MISTYRILSFWDRQKICLLRNEMNSEWSDRNKKMQKLIGKQTTYAEGMKCLFELRSTLFSQITQIVDTLPSEAFSRMPFKGAEGYHSKTLAYSIWHIFRIEDIVAHSMIAGNEQVFFAGNWLEKTGSRIITTGNELEGDQIADFSRILNIRSVYDYAASVKLSTEKILQNISYADLKRTFGESDRKKLMDEGCVDHSENAVWLIDYWCRKNISGLIKMPFSRHWIMHIEAMQRIRDRL